VPANEQTLAPHVVQRLEGRGSCPPLTSAAGGSYACLPHSTLPSQDLSLPGAARRVRPPVAVTLHSLSTLGTLDMLVVVTCGSF
jgi:hypothetical protein